MVKLSYHRCCFLETPTITADKINSKKKKNLEMASKSSLKNLDHCKPADFGKQSSFRDTNIHPFHSVRVQTHLILFLIEFNSD